MAGTFRFEYVPLPLPSTAQSLLINRGCPPDAIDLNPADEATRGLFVVSGPGTAYVKRTR